jgi:hypothetical protein
LAFNSLTSAGFAAGAMVAFGATFTGVVLTVDVTAALGLTVLAIGLTATLTATLAAGLAGAVAFLTGVLATLLVTDLTAAEMGAGAAGTAAEGARVVLLALGASAWPVVGSEARSACMADVMVGSPGVKRGK